MRILIGIVLAVLFTCGLLASCSDANREGTSVSAEPEDFELALVYLDHLEAERPKNPWDTTSAMPDEECIKLRLNYPGGTLRKLFNDSNHLHYQVAERIGIEPLVLDSLVWPIKRPLVRIESNKLYYVDELRHSFPYLIPESKALLDEIGQRFHDTLAARGGGPYRLKVTSLLRTRNTVSRLRRVNRASVDSSAHLFGTTFDISFTNFPYSGGTPHRTQEDLKNLLAEILYSLREQNRCYIIYEHKPGCFHITVRDSLSNT